MLQGAREEVRGTLTCNEEDKKHYFALLFSLEVGCSFEVHKVTYMKYKCSKGVV